MKALVELALVVLAVAAKGSKIPPSRYRGSQGQEMHGWVGYTQKVMKSSTEIDENASRVRIAEAVQRRAEFLGMSQNAFVVTTRMNWHDLSDLLDGKESEITFNQLQDALKILHLSDSAREIVDLVTKGIPDAGTPEVEKAPLTIGDLIRIRRNELKLRQSDLAAMMGVSQALVAQWETGRTRLMAEDVGKLAEVLKTTRGYFVGESYAEVAGKIMQTVDSMIGNMGKPVTRDLREAVLIAMFGEMTHAQKNLLMGAAMEIVLKEAL